MTAIKTYDHDNSATTNENRKFGPTSGGDVGVRIFSDSPLSVTSDDVAYDRIDATYPDGVTEVYTYSLLGTNTLITTVVYSDTSKKTLLSMVKNVI